MSGILNRCALFLPATTRLLPNDSFYARMNENSNARKAFFFDRDGVVNKRIIDGYVLTKEEFVLLPAIIPILRFVKKAGYLAILVTNQQGVGKGLMSADDLAEIHRHMQETLRASCGYAFDDIYQATELDDGFAMRRKPSPAMLLEAQAKWGLHLERSWMLGDSLSDAQAGRAAGTRAILIGDYAPSDADAVEPNLETLAERLPELLARVE